MILPFVVILIGKDKVDLDGLASDNKQNGATSKSLSYIQCNASKNQLLRNRPASVRKRYQSMLEVKNTLT